VKFCIWMSGMGSPPVGPAPALVGRLLNDQARARCAARRS
jgi:hypothetical protein